MSNHRDRKTAHEENFVMYESQMRIWLKDIADKDIYKPDESKPERSFFGYRVQEDDKRNTFIVVKDFTDPLVPLPPIPIPYIAKVTYRGVLSQNSTFRPEGVYRRGKAMMSLKNYINPHTNPPLGYQKMEAEARGMKSLRDIYTLVRQGKLQPIENWSA
jgi:hypothetical protein